MRTLIALMAVLVIAAPVRGAENAARAVSGKAQPPPLVTTSRQFTALKYKPVTAVPVRKTLILKNLKLRPIEPAAETVKPKGPDPTATLDLGDVIDDAALLEDLSQACGWDSHLLMQDLEAAHVFYYVPREFLLQRDPGGYRLHVQYNARAEAGQPSVMLTAELASPYRHGDVKLLKSILRQALGLKSADLLEVKALPGLGATADLQALTAGLTLPPERIHLSPPAHLKQMFRLTLSLTQDETEEVLAQIAGAGLVGSLNVSVGDTQVPVPIRIQYERFAGPKLEGFDSWTRGRSIATVKNLTDFPIQIDSINAYRLRNGQLERVAKKLKALDIAPGTAKPFKLPPAKKLLGDNLMVSWVGSELDASCTKCLKTVDLAVRRGVGLAPGSRIHLEAIPSLFEEFGLYKLIVHVQSPYFTAGGTTVQEQELALTADANESSDLMVFIPGDRGANPLLYKYRLEAITETGESHLEPEWHDARKLGQFFGSSHLEGLLGDTEDELSQDSGESTQ